MSTTVPVYPADVENIDAEKADELWMDAVGTVVTKAYERMPEHLETIKNAYQLIVDGKVEPSTNGGYIVASGLAKGRVSWHVNGKCDCPDWAQVPQGLCVHKLATMIWTRATQLLAGKVHQEPAPAPSTEPAPGLADTAEPTRAFHIAPEHIVTIQGQSFVRFAGLLLMAHEKGLLHLSAVWTFNDPELSLAHAVATFQDGRRFEESGDASPATVNKKVAGHFRRVALTRAKARALRDALGCDLVSVEELSE
jgi:hypothetical protein